MTKSKQLPPPAARAAATLADPRWAAVVARDAAADGAFVFAVRTTGVCCRPSCGARAPRPENVEFFADLDAAVIAGYRSCKRCRPDRLMLEQLPAVVLRAVAAIEAAEALPTLAELASAVGTEPRELQRAFLDALGMTPRDFATAHRAEHVRRALHAGASVTQAQHAAGFGSSSRLHAAAPGALGMAPSTFRRGAPGVLIEFAAARCSLGVVLAAGTAAGLCAILLGDDAVELEADLRSRFPRAEFVAGAAPFAARLAAVVAFVDAPRGRLTLPLDLRGTVFQRRVWHALQAIPAGTTVGYAELGERLGMPRGARAIARACAQNPLAVAVPCHRVVRGDGDLAGYRWGLARKRALLERERGGARGGEREPG